MVEISNANNNKSRILKTDIEKINNNCLTVVDAKNHGQRVLKLVNEGKMRYFLTQVTPPVLFLVDVKKRNKHELYILGYLTISVFR
jgi:hypothetical protein